MEVSNSRDLLDLVEIAKEVTDSSYALCSLLVK